MAFRMVAAVPHFMLRPYDDGDEEDFTRRAVMQHLIEDEQHFVLQQLSGYQHLADGAHLQPT